MTTGMSRGLDVDFPSWWLSEALAKNRKMPRFALFI